MYCNLLDFTGLLGCSLACLQDFTGLFTGLFTGFTRLYWTLLHFILPWAPFWPNSFFQFSSKLGANSAYFWCKTEEISMRLGTSLILILASIAAVATSPIYLVKLRPDMSFKIDSFWLSVKPFIFRTKAVFFLRVESNFRRSMSSGRDSMFKLLFRSPLFHSEHFLSSSNCSKIAEF